MKLATINLSLYLASSSSAADLPASDAARTLGGKSARKLIAEAAEAEAEVEPPPPRSAAEISALTSNVKTIFSLEDIKGILPHRYPFLLVDKVVEYEQGKRKEGRWESSR